MILNLRKGTLSICVRVPAGLLRNRKPPIFNLNGFLFYLKVFREGTQNVHSQEKSEHLLAKEWFKYCALSRSGSFPNSESDVLLDLVFLVLYSKKHDNDRVPSQNNGGFHGQYPIGNIKL